LGNAYGNGWATHRLRRRVSLGLRVRVAPRPICDLRSLAQAKARRRDPTIRSAICDRHSYLISDFGHRDFPRMISRAIHDHGSYLMGHFGRCDFYDLIALASWLAHRPYKLDLCPIGVAYMRPLLNGKVARPTRGRIRLYPGLSVSCVPNLEGWERDANDTCTRWGQMGTRHTNIVFPVIIQQLDFIKESSDLTVIALADKVCERRFKRAFRLWCWHPYSMRHADSA